MQHTYDFATRVDRRGAGSSKWEAMYAERGDLPAHIVPLSVADMELVNPPEVRDALHELVEAGPLGYTCATDRFREACAAWQRRRHGWDADPDWIVTSPGVVPALFNAVRTLTEPGEGVIVQTPAYPPFSRAVEANGRRLVENPLVLSDGRYRMDLEGLERAAADPYTTMLVLCSPHNPVGRVWEPGELAAVVEICRSHGLVLVSDEIHNDLVMPGHAHTTVGALADGGAPARTVVCTAPSKTFNLAGCQASVIWIPDEDLRGRFQAGWDQIAQGGLNAFAYTATVAAYERCEGWLDGLIELVWGNYGRLRAWATARHPELWVAPLEGTYLAWVDFSAWGLTPAELERFMKDEALLWLDEGVIFGSGGEGFERINLAAPAGVIDDALARLDAAADRRGLGGEGA